MNAKCVKVLAVISATTLVFALFLLFFEHMTQKQNREPSEKFLVNFVFADIAGIAVKNNLGSLALMVRDGQIICLDQPTDTKMNTSLIKSFFYRMTHIPVYDELEKVSDLDIYGLDSPIATVSVVLNSKEKVRFTLGDQAPFEKGWYVAIEGEKKIYIIDNVSAKMMQYSVDNLRLLDVLPELNAEIKLKDLEMFRLINGEKEIFFTSDPSSKSARFILMLPEKINLDWEKVTKAVFLPLLSITDYSFVSSAGVFADYGLKERGGTELFLTLKGIDTHLFFSEATNGSFFVCREGSNQIISIPEKELSILNVKISDIIGDAIYSVNPADLKSVIISGNGIDFNCNFSGIGNDLHAVLNGNLLSQEESIDFAQIISLLPKSSSIKENTSIERDPSLTIVYKLCDASEHIITIFPSSKHECAVFLDGNAIAMTYSSTVEELVYELEAYL
ncbi:DUF4340 domain-containing protein [Treponema parvum]|uniref:DUF4340 domain-containing protein n=1 Tax=Treponema parvum TaxID=138851 RepID=A0A975F3I7_9SPIR|nr:DUF4340 domain-containing protein [Treponema parvum]QTQ13686.1 DUF4340 domain-containing protein [Treponema parvum]